MVYYSRFARGANVQTWTLARSALMVAILSERERAG